jgi:hypothetical protein
MEQIPDTVRKEFLIPKENVIDFANKIKKLSNKAIKLGQLPITVIYCESVMKMVIVDADNEKGYAEINIEHIKVIVEGSSPKINGFTFIATLDHLPTGTNIFRAIEGFAVDEKFRHADKNCEHCNSKRNRKDTYIIQNELGQKQVGRNCLKDYTGHKSPEKIAAYYEILIECFEVGNQFGSVRGSEAVNIETLLAFANKSIRIDGWVSCKTAFEIGISSTKSKALSAIAGSKTKESQHLSQLPEEKDFELARLVSFWAKEMIPNNSYLLNLKALFETEYVEHRSCGIVVSAIIAYHKALEMEMETEQFKSQKNSQYVGEIKKRQLFELTILNTFSYENAWGGGTVYKMSDSAGNVFVTFNLGKNSNVEIGKTYKIIGTVVKHGTYKDIKQTVINRCKVEHLEEIAKMQ